MRSRLELTSEAAASMRYAHAGRTVIAAGRASGGGDGNLRSKARPARSTQRHARRKASSDGRDCVHVRSRLTGFEGGDGQGERALRGRQPQHHQAQPKPRLCRACGQSAASRTAPSAPARQSAIQRHGARQAGFQDPTRRRLQPPPIPRGRAPKSPKAPSPAALRSVRVRHPPASAPCRARVREGGVIGRVGHPFHVGDGQKHAALTLPLPGQECRQRWGTAPRAPLVPGLFGDPQVGGDLSISGCMVRR